VFVSKVAHGGRLTIKKVMALPLGSDADGTKRYGCPATTLTGAVPEIVGGSPGAVGGAELGAETLIRNGPTVAWLTPSDTPISISAVVPASSADGVPFNSPVQVLKLAHTGIFVISNVSELLSVSETLGV
jgi:hypothetical protein